MDGLVIGIDLCDNRTHITCADPDRTWVIPTVICRNRNSDEWYADEEAYAHALVGDGVIEDKLLMQVKKDGTATISGIRYDAGTLLQKFLMKCLEYPRKEAGNTEIDSLVISLENPDVKVMDCLMYCADDLGIDRRRVHIISHTDSFIYYVMSQKRELWSNQVGMYSLEDENLRYYELRVQRGLRKMMVLADSEKQEESFRLDVMETPAGKKVADKILATCAERNLGRRLFSGIILTGKGFEETDWAPEFMKKICARRRVFTETSLFYRGACLRAKDYLRSKTEFPFSCICDGHLKSTVSVRVVDRDRDSQLVMAAAGEGWYEAKSTSEFIVAGEPEIEFTVTPLDQRKKKVITIPLEGFPERPDRTTKIRLSLGFSDERTMVCVIRDMGFGEFFPATDTVIKREVEL